MPSLVDLQTFIAEKNQGNPDPGGLSQDPRLIATPRPPKSEAAQAPAALVSEKGDELIAKARGYQKLNNEEERLARLFAQSKDIVQKKIEEDPTYGDRVLPELDAVSGDLGKLTEKLIDEADKVKIEFLKKEKPEWFQGSDAAVMGFLNEASFGQLTKIMGKVGEMIGDRPYEQIVEEKAEQMRLLQKAFPGSFTAGQVGSYLIPGSPAKLLFTKAASMGGKLAMKFAGSAASKLAANPRLAQAVLQSAGAGGAGAAAVGTVSGTLGSDLQDLSFDRGLEQGAMSGVMGAITGGAVPALGAGVKKTAEVASPYIRQAGRAVDKGLGGLVEQISGNKASTLRAFNRNAEAIKGASNTQAEIGANLVDFLQSQKSGLPEVQQAELLLEKLPPVNATRLLKHLQSAAGKGNNPGEDSGKKLLLEWANRFSSRMDSKGMVPASVMNEFKRDMQRAAEDAFGKETNHYLTNLKIGSRVARMSIEEAARAKGGEAGKLYVDLMGRAAGKVSLLKFMGRQLGNSVEVQEKRAEGFISNIFGKNKTVVQQRLADLDSKFGTNFLEQARNANYAKELGPNGVPQMLSTHPTGRSLIGMALGGAAGAAVGAVTGDSPKTGALIGAVASSPRAGAMMLGASSQITGFVRRMVANPEALARLAGRVQASGSPNAARQAATLRVPFEVRKVADAIYTSLQKDGPISAGGVTRLIADTPYFVGLVHYYDLAEQRMKNRDTKNALSNQIYQQEIARPPTQ